MNTPTEKCSHPDCGFYKDGAGTGCRAMRDNACASEHATEAGTPASPAAAALTVDTPKLRNLLGDLWHAGSDNNADTAALENSIIAHIDQWGAARAEEARREAATEIADLKERLAREVLLSTEAAQRMAGGEAVAWAAGRSMHADITTSPETAQVWRDRGIRVEALGYIGVAEAAAQADEAALFAEFFNSLTRDEKLSVPQEVAGRVGAYMTRNGYRIVSGRWYLQAAPTAQPTLPDDELDAEIAQMELAMDKRYPIPDSPHGSAKSRAYNDRCAYANGWMDRADLRQPGALPAADGRGEDAVRLDWLEQNNQTFCGNYGGTDFRAIGSSIWHGTLRDAIDAARAAASPSQAKQSGEGK